MKTSNETENGYTEKELVNAKDVSSETNTKEYLHRGNGNGILPSVKVLDTINGNDVPQQLKDLRSIITTNLNLLTNQAYSRNIKMSYRIIFRKGVAAITADDKTLIKDYHEFIFYCVDKTKNKLGDNVTLYSNYYPASIKNTAIKNEIQALNDFLFNAVVCLYNMTYSVYLEGLKKQVVTVEDVAKELEEKPEIITEEKPKLIV